MTEAAPLPNALAAASRARDLATIARRRAERSPARQALHEIADLLDIAVLSFTTEPPGVVAGVTISNEIPADAYFALADAERLAASDRRTGFPAQLGQYVTQPVYRNAVDVPAALSPKDPVQADHETGLVAVLQFIHEQLGPDTPEGLATGLLEAAFALHGDLARLAETVDTTRQASTEGATNPRPTAGSVLFAALAEHGVTAYVDGGMSYTIPLDQSTPELEIYNRPFLSVADRGPSIDHDEADHTGWMVWLHDENGEPVGDRLYGAGDGGRIDCAAESAKVAAFIADRLSRRP